MAAITVTKLRKEYPKVTALAGIDLEVTEGEVFGVIGPNGAGKTTLMRILLDILRPTSGDLRVLGHDPRTSGKELRAQLGYLPGEFHVDPKISGLRHLKYWAALTERPGRAMSRARQLADRLDYDMSRPTGKLSKGNKQKLGLIQAFMGAPRLLILDEPTSGLDPLVQQTFLTLVREAQQAGATVVLSSHVLSEVEQVATRAAILRRGRIITAKPITELRESTERTVRAVVTNRSVGELETALATAGLPLRVTETLIHDGRAELVIEGQLTGDINPLVKFLADYQLADLTLIEPDLAASVLHIYETEAAGK